MLRLARSKVAATRRFRSCERHLPRGPELDERVVWREEELCVVNDDRVEKSARLEARAHVTIVALQPRPTQHAAYPASKKRVGREQKRVRLQRKRLRVPIDRAREGRTETHHTVGRRAHATCRLRFLQAANGCSHGACEHLLNRAAQPVCDDSLQALHRLLERILENPRRVPHLRHGDRACNAIWPPAAPSCFSLETDPERMVDN
eukprot:6190895-Pleurochrysis_carterae.AAC.2